MQDGVAVHILLVKAEVLPQEAAGILQRWVIQIPGEGDFSVEVVLLECRENFLEYRSAPVVVKGPVLGPPFEGFIVPVVQRLEGANPPFAARQAFFNVARQHGNDVLLDHLYGSEPQFHPLPCL